MIDCLRLLLHSDCRLNKDGASIPPESRYPLDVAAAYSNVEAVKLLLEHKADVAAKDEYNRPAIFNAVFPTGRGRDYSSSGRLAVTELLLDAGADVNVTNNRGQTPLVHMLWECVLLGGRDNREILPEIARVTQALLMRGPSEIEKALEMAMRVGLGKESAGCVIGFKGLYDAFS